MHNTQPLLVACWGTHGLELCWDIPAALFGKLQKKKIAACLLRRLLLTCLLVAGVAVPIS